MSALVELHAYEAGSRMVRAAVGRARLVATNLLAYAEARSAVTFARFDGALNAAARACGL